MAQIRWRRPARFKGHKTVFIQGRPEPIRLRGELVTDDPQVIEALRSTGTEEVRSQRKTSKQ